MAPPWASPLPALLSAWRTLTHGAFVPAILFDIGWGALYGLLTYWSGSIVPAIILHSSADALGFIAAWKFPPTAPAPLVWVTGPDAWLWFNCALVVLLGSASVWAFRRLGRTHSNSPESLNECQHTAAGNQSSK